MRNRVWLVGALLMSALFAGAALRVDAQSADERTVRALYDRYLVAFRAKDIDKIMSLYLPNESLVVFDAVPPRQYLGAKAFRKDYEGFFAVFPGPNAGKFDELHVTAAGTLAYAHTITDVFRKINGKWIIVHEHASWPVDPATGKADFLSKP
jgi:ketosteroid isomerase-like protein